MDKFHTLAQTVIRMFYPEDHVVAFDQLVSLHVIEEGAFMRMLGLNNLRHFGEVVGRLKRDQLIRSRTFSPSGREETGVHTPHVTIWYLDYIHFTKVVKFKLKAIELEIERDVTSGSDQADFQCKSCESKFSQLEAMQTMDMESGKVFCLRCSTELEHAVDKRVARGAEMYPRFMETVRPVIDLLKETDGLVPDIIDVADVIAKLQAAHRKAELSKEGVGKELRRIYDHKEGEQLLDAVAEDAVVADDAVEAFDAEHESEVETDIAEPGWEGPLVKVGTESVPLLAVTREQKLRMTAEEYHTYYEQYAAVFGPNERMLVV